MELNTVHHVDFINNRLPDKCANLIIADPPYFRVKGDFDFIWDSFEDYLKDVEKWAIECKRLLTENGTLFWWGDAKKIAYSQIIIDKHFNLINNLTWNKGSFMGLEESKGLRSFAPCTERVLMYSNEVLCTGLEKKKLDINNFKTLRNYFKDLHEWIGVSRKKIIEKIGQSADHSFRWGSSQWSLPTEETYNKLIRLFSIDTFYKYKKYEELREEYEELRRPFNNRFNLQEVLNFSNESQKTSVKYNHNTVKPEKLTRALILTCSRKNDLVVVPFAGSGTECAMSVKEKRRFVGFEIDHKYVTMANKRVKKILKEPTLF